MESRRCGLKVVVFAVYVLFVLFELWQRVKGTERDL